MGLQTARAFFMWCTIINAVLLTLSLLVLTFAGDWIYRTHSKLFPMPRETFNAVIYSFIGVYKAFTQRLRRENVGDQIDRSPGTLQHNQTQNQGWLLLACRFRRPEVNQALMLPRMS